MGIFRPLAFIARILEKAQVIDFVIIFTVIGGLLSSIYFTYKGILTPDNFMLIIVSTLFVVFSALFKRPEKE